MNLSLATDVYAVMIDDDAVFLDVGADAYFCLPNIAAHLTLTGRLLATDDEGLALDLMESGLASEEKAGEAGLSTTSPTLSARAVMEEFPVHERPRSILHCWISLIGACVFSHHYKTKPLKYRLPPSSRKLASPATISLLADINFFRRVVPWLPVDGECLYRSGLLRRYLIALGHEVDWIFGVTTWPFNAHCWLQVGDMALDDEADRLVAYHHIMVR